MNFNISSWAIRNPVPVVVLFTVLTVTGIINFKKLPINSEPDMKYPAVNVTVNLDGASPDELEKTVTIPVEDALAGMAGVRHTTSVITEGASVTTVEFTLETDTDRAVNDVRNTVSQIKDNLPGDISFPVVERVDTEGGALGYYAVQSPGLTQTELSRFIDEQITHAVLSVSGVQQVKRLGGEKQEIRVELNASKLEEYGVSADQISRQIAQTNVNVPGGRLNIHGGQEMSIRVLGSKPDTESLGELPISLNDGRKIKLSECANIHDGHAEIRTRTFLDGRETLGFQVYRAKGFSDTVVERGVSAVIDELAAEYPDVRISRVYSSVEVTEENYLTTCSTMIEGAVLTVLVVWLFLQNWRATLVSALALPLSILPVFSVLLYLDYTLNSISLLAITLVIGILVDDAIVEIENIEHHAEKGKRPYRAALDGSGAISKAVIAITSCIVAVFLPVSFIGGMTGQYFRQFGITIAAAVISSLMVARMVTPLMAAYILQPKKMNAVADGAEKARGRLSSAVVTLYARVLSGCVRFRKTTLTCTLLFMTVSLSSMLLVPTGFLPKSDTGIVQINIELQPGSNLNQTVDVLRHIEKTARSFKETELVFATAGTDGVEKGEVLVRLRPYGERDISQKEFEDMLQDELRLIPDIRYMFRNELAERDVSVILNGTDSRILSETAFALKQQMSSMSSVRNVQVNEPLMRSELKVVLRDDEAAASGVTSQAVGTMLRIATIGDTDSNNAKFNLNDRQIPIRVTLRDADRNNPEILKHLRVSALTGGSVRLDTVADISLGSSVSSIQRYDRKRRVAVEADMTPGEKIGSVLAEVENLPIMKNLPQGVSMPMSGDSESMDEMFSEFTFAMLTGVLAVIMILALLFRDFFQPFTIITAMPLSFGGAACGLLLYDAALDMSSVIGILMLMGIVTKNSILLVDFIIEKRKAGSRRYDSILSSGKTRLRPILMTTAAMVLGMIPALFTGGAGASFRSQMAVAVISGLICSTFFSLITVPVIYTFADDLKVWIVRKLSRLVTVTEEDKKLS